MVLIYGFIFQRRVISRITYSSERVFVAPFLLDGAMRYADTVKEGFLAYGLNLFRGLLFNSFCSSIIGLLYVVFSLIDIVELR